MQFTTQPILHMGPANAAPTGLGMCSTVNDDCIRIVLSLLNVRRSAVDGALKEKHGLQFWSKIPNRVLHFGSSWLRSKVPQVTHQWATTKWVTGRPPHLAV